MTNWLPSITERKGPRYLAIADAIGDAISSGELKPEQRLPTHRDLAYHLGVTVGTVSRAYAEAVRRDYVSGEVGRGTYVRPGEVREKQFRIPYKVEPNTFDFALNYQAAASRVDYLRSSLMVLAQDPGLEAVMYYQSEKGMDHHRRILAKWAASYGVPEDYERIVVSNGVQHAMQLSLTAVCKAGDTVMCEEYSYPGIKGLAAQSGLKLHGVAMDENGLIPDRFEEAILATGSRVLYFMPNFQNPTGVHMSSARRHEIAKIAEQYKVWLIEDDIYGFLAENHEKNISFAALLPDQTFYLNGASKCIAPGLRVGFILAPQSHVDMVAACMRMSSWMASPLNIEICTRWIEDGTMEKVIESSRVESRKRQAIMRKHLGDYNLKGAIGCYHDWLILPKPWRADTFCMRARERNVSILPAHVFHIGKKEPVNAVRICYGAPRNAELVEEGMSRLAQLINEEIHAFHSVM
jgi:DNA-binding transcriptional MocR family regulator